MKIAIDAFGGDNSPQEIIKGAALAREYGEQLILCGDAEQIAACARQTGTDLSGIVIEQAASVISMHDDPKTVLKAKADSSMAVGLKMVADGRADAFVSAGNTGALLMGGTFIVKRLHGVKRPAIAAVAPALDGCYMLIDSGANAEARPEMLVQFAQMGSIYMQQVQGVDSPRVGLLNNGAEDTKGTEMVKETYALLKNCAGINFIGNVEGRDLPLFGCDVAVADGFTGNICLKTMEGMGKLMSAKLKGIFYKNLATKLGGALVKKGIDEFRLSMDSSEQGGAPLLGLRGTVIKAHGSSDARAIKNAVRQAIACCRNGVADKICAAVSGADGE